MHGRRLQRPRRDAAGERPNAGSVPGFPDSLVVETLGPLRPRRHPPAADARAAEHLQGLVEALADYQQAAADAAWSGDARDAVQALAAHPLVRSIDLAERLYAEMAEAHRASCRSGWPRPEVRRRARARGPRSRSVEGVTAPPRNLVNLNARRQGLRRRSVLRDVTLGLAEGDRIGVVGRNGEGKSTLLRLSPASRTPTPAR